MKTTTLYFTKLFTGGNLKGILYTGTMTFVSPEAASEFIKAGRKGVKRPIGGSPYRIVDASFQDYRRDL